jgi:hypothetical protein
MFFLDVKDVFLLMFFETQKCDVGLVEKNIKGTCKHACTFEHVQNLHMHFLDYKMLPCHFHLNIHVGSFLPQHPRRIS